MAGDPCRDHCEATVALLRARLGSDERALILSCQSRGGRQEWIGPGAEETLVALAGRGVENVMVITPGFASDRVETLEEIAIGVVDAFSAAGGKRFSAVPCLNDGPASIAMLAQVADPELRGWSDRDADPAARPPRSSAKR